LETGKIRAKALSVQRNKAENGRDFRDLAMMRRETGDSKQGISEPVTGNFPPVISEFLQAIRENFARRAGRR
jgi:hypothetical protein